MKILKDEEYKKIVEIYEYLRSVTVDRPYVLKAENGSMGYWIFKEYLYKSITGNLRDILNSHGYVDNPHKRL